MNQRDGQGPGYTPLHFASNVFVVRALLVAGALHDITSDYGELPLHRLVAGHDVNPAAIDALLDAGTDIEARVAPREDVFYGPFYADPAAGYCAGRTPLHCAVAGSSATAIAELLRRGAATDARTDRGLMPLDLHICTVRMMRNSFCRGESDDFPVGADDWKARCGSHTKAKHAISHAGWCGLLLGSGGGMPCGGTTRGRRGRLWSQHRRLRAMRTGPGMRRPSLRAHAPTAAAMRTGRLEVMRRQVAVRMWLWMDNIHQPEVPVTPSRCHRPDDVDSALRRASGIATGPGRPVIRQ